MSMLNKFRNIVLAGALTLPGLSGVFGEARGAEANSGATVETVSAGRDMRLIPEPQKSPLQKAVEFSSKGVSFFLVVGKDDSNDYKIPLKGLMTALKTRDVPSQVYGVRSNDPKTYLHFIVDGVTYTGFPVGVIREGNMDGYKIDDIRNGRIGHEAVRAYTEAFLTPQPKLTTELR